MDRKIEQETAALQDSIKKLNTHWTVQIERENSIIPLRKSLRRSTKDHFFPGIKRDIL